MKRNKGKEKAYYSIEEIEEKFFPNSLRKQLPEMDTDPHVFGVNLARESLDRIKHLLRK